MLEFQAQRKTSFLSSLGRFWQCRVCYPSFTEFMVSVLYASTRVTFHFVLRHSRHLSVIPVTSPSFPSPLRHSRHTSIIPVTSPSPLSLYFTYRSLSSFIISPSFVFRLFLHYGSIPPLSCSEHHFSDLWLHYHTLTSSHSCGWTISLLSS